jgi:hypothetical protein
VSESGDRLARSRLALIERMQHKDRRREREQERYDELQALGLPMDEDGFSSGEGWLGTVRHALGAWWRHHPAHMVVQLATPALAGYAQRKPLHFIGIAAAAGAVVMLARPWKLISATGLLVALLKSSQLSGLVMSAMSAADFQKDHQRPPR